MRIRKHAKISPLAYATSSLKPGTVLQTYVCQLNQSPWDVMNFPPPSTPPRLSPPIQVDGDGVSAGNGSSGDCISAAERDNVWDEIGRGQQQEYSSDIPEETAAFKMEEPPPPPKKEEEQEVILCCKTDGKSWQCRREASKGSSLCAHHYSQARSYNHNSSSSSHHATAKKSEKLETRCGARAKKSSTYSASNPYEFYYYSGFGPRWGKKRGERRKNSSDDDDNDDVDGGGSMNKNVDASEPAITGYDEYECEDEEENRDIIIGKKRVRKPIKARSLKSLM